MLGRLRIALVGVAVLVASPWAAATASETEAREPTEQEWPFHGIFGQFDRAELQRGFHVFNQVCAGCHSLEHIAYRHLSGIGLSEDEIKAIAAEIDVTDGPDEFGDSFERPGRPSDPYIRPFDNEAQARAANGGAFPPDLTLITKARPAGPDYVHALLTGYGETPPEDYEPSEGKDYNPYFKTWTIGMPEPLFEDAVEFADGTVATVDQMARDVSAFLAWAAEPELERRKQAGFVAVAFLIILTGLLYASKRQMWAKLH
ncbi:MAG: cytochrome c1 [Alphaproteobacteria bacterium]